MDRLTDAQSTQILNYVESLELLSQMMSEGCSDETLSQIVRYAFNVQPNKANPIEGLKIIRRFVAEHRVI